MDGDLILAIVFYSLVGFFLYKYRNKFTQMYKLVFVRKTKLGIKLMKSLSQHRLFWKIYSTLAIPVAVYFAVWIGKMLYDNAVQIVSGTASAGVALAIPGIRVPGSPIFIPLFQGLIAIVVLAVVHEFSHGVIAALEGVRIKSTGFGFFLFLPLAFVELDETQMKKLPKLSQMRIAAAGAFANIVLWIIIMGFLSYVIAPITSAMTVYDGLNITGVTSGSPAEEVGIPVGAVLFGINGKQTMNLQEFAEELQSHSPNETITMNTDKGNFTLTLSSRPDNPELPYIGINMQQLSHTSKDARDKYGFLLDVFSWLVSALWWTGTLNFLVGIMNFLPIFGLDGSLIFYNLFGYVIRNEKVLTKLLTVVFSAYLMLLLFNIFGPLFF